MQLNSNKVRARAVKTLSNTFLHTLEDECFALACELYDRSRTDPPKSGAQIALNVKINVTADAIEAADKEARDFVRKRR
jgi:hypothetical protein